MKHLRNLGLVLVFVLSLSMVPTSSASIIVDFTTPGTSADVITGASFVFTTQDPTGTGVSFTVTAAEVNPGGGANGPMGDIARLNGGLGSTVENGGGFVNVIGGVSEQLSFTVSGVTGLAVGETIELSALLSQNANSTNANQSSGFGGTFGNNVNDGVIITSDLGPSINIVQSDAGDLNAILLNSDNGDSTNTGNTFAHSAGNLAFTNSFTLALDDLTANNAITVQGFEFEVIPAPVVPAPAVPEPTAFGFLGLCGLAGLMRRRKRLS